MQPNGVKSNLGIGELSDYEKGKLDEVGLEKRSTNLKMNWICGILSNFSVISDVLLTDLQVITELKKNIKKGEDFVSGK